MLVRAKQASSLEEYISEVSARSLEAGKIDELTKTLLFTEELSNPDVQRVARLQPNDSE